MKTLVCLLALMSASALAQTAPPPPHQVTTHVVTDQDVKGYADAAAKMERAMERARGDAVTYAKAYLQAAQTRCRQQLATRPEYKAASDQLAKKLAALGNPGSLTPESRAALGTDIEELNKSIAQMEATALAADPDIKAANAMMAKLGAAPQPVEQAAAEPAPTVIPPAATSPPGSALTPAASTGSMPGRAIAAPAPGRPLTGQDRGRLIHDGWNKIMAKDYGAALPLFEAASRGGEIRDLTLLMGRGICEYELKDYKAAEKDMDHAYTLTASHPSRQLSIAYAGAEVMNGNPMRAVRVLMDLTKAGVRLDQLDEELQNDLGIALSHADAQARMGDLYRDGLKYYMDYDKRLNEQKHDGTARWGTQWLPEALAAAKWRTYQQAAARVDQANYNFQRAQATMTTANSNYQEIQGGLRLHGTYEIKRYTDEWHAAIRNVKAAQANLDAANAQFKSTEGPPFPDRIECEWQEPR
jgi:hypothetical protein